MRIKCLSGFALLGCYCEKIKFRKKFLVTYGKAYDIMKLAKANDDTKTDSSGNSQDFFK